MMNSSDIIMIRILYYSVRVTDSPLVILTYMYM